ncbi:MAG: hypothetical protein ABI597_06115 [Gammaproteobacteria bacterium]
MKLLFAAFIAIALGMLSSCAYIQGIKDQKKADLEAAASKPSSAATTIQPQATPNINANADTGAAAATASKLISPITH